MVEAGKRKLGKIREVAVPGVSSRLQFRLSRTILAQLRIGHAGKIMSLGALRQPAVLLRDSHKLLIRSLGALGAGGENAFCRRSSGLCQRRGVSIDRRTQRSVGCR